ncbi:MarR family winged helix-turn-helix transcriptional regulator [Nocardioides terrisoli]|uniref:MarR family winged helix-turn-helix transcriptional regulator n=1 Tax=Nocardioides terrisoli TaxID=3388267 RepID=UPI00287BA160|nr:MarR family transcriptional regulator [Nocardioides marmorisolisilvae]
MQRSTQPASQEDVVEAVLRASRALVAVAARSLAAAEGQVTLSQYRAMVVLASRGAQRVVDLAEALDVERSTATRMCDRLEGKGLITRERSAEDRRTVWVGLTAEGTHLVTAVTRRRTRDIRRILANMPEQPRVALVGALGSFADAAGEAPEQAWSLGWVQ